MPISDVASLVGGAALGAPFSEILKLVISEAKKVKDFKPLFEDLTSTMERLVPIFQEIDSLQERLDPVNGELNLLFKTMQRAEELVRKCSRVQWYNFVDKALYTREIKGINEVFVKFIQFDLQFIQLRNLLRSRLSQSPSQDEIFNDEALASAIQESSREKEEEEERKRTVALRKESSLREDEELASAIQESYEEEERKRAIALKKEISLREDEELASAIRESYLLRQREGKVAKRRARELEKDEDEQRIIWESLKERGKGKQTKNEVNPPHSIRGGYKIEHRRRRRRALVCVFVCVLGIITAYSFFSPKSWNL